MTTQFRSHNGTWHVASTERFQIGHRVTVTRRNGQQSEIIIRDFVAHDPARELPFLYSFDDVRRAAGAQPTDERETIPNAARLFEMFERANEMQRRQPNASQLSPRGVAVRFRLNSTERGLRFELAGRSSRYAGQLLALSQERGRAGRRAMYGVLMRDGTYNARVGATEIEREIHREVLHVLRVFADAPAATAAREGRQTGNCCFCGRGLTDSRSVTVGYGPICADYYGLPWGDEPPTPRGPMNEAERVLEIAREQQAAERELPHFGIVLDAWGRQFNVERRGRTDDEYRAAIVDQQRSIAADVPSLEDIQRMPVGMGRAAAATQRASAGLPNVQRDSQGRLRSPLDTLNELAAAHADPQPFAIAVSPNVNSGPALRPDQVVTTVRRTRPAAPAAAPAAPAAPVQRRFFRRPQVATEADETVVNMSRRPRPNLNRPLEEDDFIWPPRQ